MSNGVLLLFSFNLLQCLFFVHIFQFTTQLRIDYKFLTHAFFPVSVLIDKLWLCTVAFSSDLAMCMAYVLAYFRTRQIVIIWNLIVAYQVMKIILH